MALPRVFVTGPLSAGSIALTTTQSKRLLGSHRLREGSPFLAFCGDGTEWSARITSARATRGTAELLEVARAEPPPAPAVELLCGLVRPSRFEWALEKCVEAGADVIRPLSSENGARGTGPSRTRLERWERISIEAAEQCGRLHMPVVARPARLATILGGPPAPLLVCDRDGMPWNRATALLPSAGSLRILVGPEGGLTETELAAARAAGAIVASLGPHTLRTETAAVAATVLVRAATEQR